MWSIAAPLEMLEGEGNKNAKICLFTARVGRGGREAKRNEAVLSGHELDKALVVLGLYFYPTAPLQ